MHNVTLKSDGVMYSGWKRVTITRSMELLASSFSLSLSKDFQNGNKVLPIKFDSIVEVFIDNHQVISGIIDSIHTSYNAASHDYTINGRSLAGDLVDCSAIFRSGEFINERLDDIAVELCRPFGLSVVVNTDVGAPFARFRTDDATVFDCLERGAKQRGVLLTSDEAGNIVLTRPSTTKISTSLVQDGEHSNIKNCSAQSSMNSRYSVVIVKGQAESSEKITDAQTSQPMAKVTDGNVPRYRPLVLQGETQGNEKALAERASFEISTRYGRSAEIIYEVAGWTHQAGLWTPNQQVKVVDTINNINQWMMISSVEFSYSDDGTNSKITVMPVEAFQMQALSEQKPEFL